MSKASRLFSSKQSRLAFQSLVRVSSSCLGTSHRTLLHASSLLDRARHWLWPTTPLLKRCFDSPPPCTHTAHTSPLHISAAVWVMSSRLPPSRHHHHHHHHPTFIIMRACMHDHPRSHPHARPFLPPSRTAPAPSPCHSLHLGKTPSQGRPLRSAISFFQIPGRSYRLIRHSFLSFIKSHVHGLGISSPSRINIHHAAHFISCLCPILPSIAITTYSVFLSD